MCAAKTRSGTIHIVQRMAPGGIETLVLDLVSSGGADDRIISLEGETASLVAAWPALRPVADRLDTFAAAPGLKPGLVWSLAARLRALRPAAVVVHHIGPLIYGGFASRLAGVLRLVHVEHDVWHYEAPRRRQIAAIIERVLKPHHVAVSEKAAITMRAVLGEASITVIPNGIDLDRFAPGDRGRARRILGLDPGMRVVGTAGRLVPVKGHEVLVEAMAKCAPETHLVIAGDGPERAALTARAERLGIASRVHFLGHVDRVETVLPAFDVFCLPSHAEGFPRSVIEAQASGLPVVATDVGALSEAVCPTTGRIVPAGDVGALAAALGQVLSRPATPATRAYVAERFSWDRTVAAYREVTGAGAAPARVTEYGHAA